MKKIIFLWSVLIISLIFVGCSKKTVMIGEMDMEFTSADLKEGKTGNQVTLNQDQTQELYNSLADIEFIQDNSNKKNRDWDFWIAFNQDTEVIKEFGIYGEDTLKYDGKLYKSKDKAINKDYLNSYFYYSFHARVLDKENGLLITPEKNTMEAKSSDKISVGLTDTKIYGMDGKEMTLDQFMVGDRIKVTYNGMIAESYPAQISSYEIEVVERNVLMEGYLAIVDDLYQEDESLNHDITMIAVDTSEWISLTDEEKDFILKSISHRYGFEVIEGTFDELADEGLIDKGQLYFPNGILIEINNLEYQEEKQILTGAMKKWRSGLGAIGSDFTAKFEKDTWTLKKENMWIS